MRQDCQPIHDDLADLVAGDPAAIARHSAHLASCDDCRDARHEAARVAELLPAAGADYVVPHDLVERVLAAAQTAPTMTDLQPALPQPALQPALQPAVDLPTATAPVATAPTLPQRNSAPQVIPITAAPRRRRIAATVGALAALAAGSVGVYSLTRDRGDNGGVVASTDQATVKLVDRAAKDKRGGLEVRDGDRWRVVHANDQLTAGSELRTDEHTRAVIELADGTQWTLDYRTTLALGSDDIRHAKLTSGRIVGEVVAVADRPVRVDTANGHIDVVGTRFAATASDKLTVVQVVRGAVVLVSSTGKETVRAGEEGVIDGDALAVNAAPGLAREVEWSELGGKDKDTQAGAGLGALRAYKPGESRDRDWNLALANHDVKVRIVGPIARTEITETFRNDSAETLEGVYQFPLPADAQIDGLALDVKDAPGGFEQGAFLDKQRAQKIWNGVIEKAAPKKLEIAQNEIIWVDGSWRDPALLDWKRGGRFELKIFPIPAKGSRTIKISYTQVVTPRGPWRQYVYPLAHSADGSTVADRFGFDLEIRGAAPGQLRTAGYTLVADPARNDVNGRTLNSTGFVPHGDLVVDYLAADGNAELRAWTYAGGFAVAPDDKLAAKKNVGIDDKVLAAQRAVANDTRPTAVLAVRPKLPRWREATSRDYVIVVDSSQSMVGERYTRAGELVTRLVEQLDRRDRFTVAACDSDCRFLDSGALRTPTVAAASAIVPWLTEQPAAGASDLVGAIRAAAKQLPETADRERWVIYVGDGFASTGFRAARDVERALAQTKGVRISTVGIGTDADAALLAAAARGGGGSYVAWVPGQSVKSAAIASLESTFGTSLRDAKIELPSGLTDVAPTQLPTVRAGEEVLIAARMTGEVAGDVVLTGTVGGQPFTERYPLKLAVSSAPGNGFVPRLWASLAIEQIEQRGTATVDDRPRVVALSQGFGVMSKETSLLVLESQAMFDAFGVDRTVPAAKWTGQESIEEVTAVATRSMGGGRTASASSGPAKAADLDEAKSDAGELLVDAKAKKMPVAKPVTRPLGGDFGGGTGAGYGFYMRRTWIRVPSVTPYDAVSQSIITAIGDAERALAKSPDSRERHRALVQALAYAGELDRANTLAAKWLDRDRLDPQALGYQADLLGRDGKRDLALRMLAGVVDLDADRATSHDRMALAYEHLGKLTQACSHRIALTAITRGKDAQRLAAALRCTQALGNANDAELVRAAAADDATRVAADKALTAPVPDSAKRDVVIDARWDGGDDLDVSIITPDGTRVSWMGGRDDVTASDVTNTAKEQLALKSIKRGNYLVEIGRSRATTGGATAHGTIDIVVLGTKKSLPFELAAGNTHKTVGRLSISLQERVETIEPNAGLGPVQVSFGNIPNPRARQVMLARIPDYQACLAHYVANHPGTNGRIMLTVTSDAQGSTHTTAQASGDLAGVAKCIQNALASMHIEGTPSTTFRVPLVFRAPSP